MTMLTDDHSYRRHLEEALQDRFPDCLVLTDVYAKLDHNFNFVLDAFATVLPPLRRGQKSEPKMEYRKTFGRIPRKEFVERMLAGLLMVEDATNDA